MDIQKRISSFVNQLIIEYKLTQRQLAAMLDISPSRLTAYLKGREIPRVEVIIKLADIGEITVDDLLKTDKPPEKKEITVNIGEGATVGGGIVEGDVYINSIIKRTYKYTYQPGDLTEEQAARIMQHVNDIVELEKIVKQKPKSHAAVYGALKKHFKVAYYRKIREEDFPKAEAYLSGWKGRLKQSKSLPKKANDVYRKKRYGDVFGIAKSELGWSKKNVDSYIFEIFNVSSIRELSDEELETLYRKITALKRKNK